MPRTHRLGKESRHPVDHAAQRQGQEEGAKEDPRRADHRLGDHRRVGDGDGAHRLERLHRNGQAVVQS